MDDHSSFQRGIRDLTVVSDVEVQSPGFVAVDGVAQPGQLYLKDYQPRSWVAVNDDQPMACADQVRPPSARIFCSMTYRLSGRTSSVTKSVTSAGCPSRVMAVTPCSASTVDAARRRSVSVGLGETVLTGRLDGRIAELSGPDHAACSSAVVAPKIPRLWPECRRPSTIRPESSTLAPTALNCSPPT